MLYRNLLFLSPLIITFTLGILYKIIFGIRSMYNNVPNPYYCENNFGKLLQIMETEDGPAPGLLRRRTSPLLAPPLPPPPRLVRALLQTCLLMMLQESSRRTPQPQLEPTSLRGPPPPPAAQYKRIQSILRQRSVVN